MSELDSPLLALVREARAAINEARERSHLARAWELLQRRDAEGNALGPLPYTERAIQELVAAHDRDPEDPSALHHLAIACHAHAWDLELAGDDRAAAGWEEALNYWNKLAASGEFWNRLKAKWHACDPAADPAPLSALRERLPVDLLDVHVDFIRHYCEANTVDRAVSHMRLVQRSRLRPAVKNQMVHKVFEAMASKIPQARAARLFEPALATLNKFLALFPEFLPALRLHAEIHSEWLASLSYQTDWPQIVQLAQTAQEPARRLAAHPDLASEPLARAACADVAVQVARKGNARANGHFSAHRSEPLPVTDREEVRAALALSITWCRLARGCASGAAPLDELLADALHGDALCLCQELDEVMESEVNWPVKRDAMIGLLREAAARLEEALACNVADLDWRGKLTDLLTHLRDELALLGDPK